MSSFCSREMSSEKDAKFSTEMVELRVEHAADVDEAKTLKSGLRSNQDKEIESRRD